MLSYNSGSASCLDSQPSTPTIATHLCLQQSLSPIYSIPGRRGRGRVLVFISLANSQMFYILCLFLNFVKFQNNGMVHFRKFLVSCSHGTTYTRVAKWYNARARSQSAHVGNCTAAPAEIPTVSGWWKLSNYTF